MGCNGKCGNRHIWEKRAAPMKTCCSQLLRRQRSKDTTQKEPPPASRDLSHRLLTDSTLRSPLCPERARACPGRTLTPGGPNRSCLSPAPSTAGGAPQPQHHNSHSLSPVPRRPRATARREGAQQGRAAYPMARKEPWPWLKPQSKR